MKTLTIFLILLCFVSNIFGQASPTAEKIDEFGKLGCCDFEVRVDNFLLALKNQPNATGYAVISADTLSQRLYLERSLLDAKAEMHRDQSVTIIREEGQGHGPSVTFWVVPEGAEKPQFREIALDFTLSPDRKPFLFADNSEPGVCPGYSLDLGHLSEFLQANPSARGNIVISSSVKAKEYRELRTKLEENAHAANIAIDRIRFFRGATRYNSSVEIWLVPKARKPPIPTR